MKQQQTIAITNEAYKKNKDGSWVSVQVNDINTPYGIIRIPPGMTFIKGRKFSGIDFAELLDSNRS
jgi:hypothetical protein